MAKTPVPKRFKRASELKSHKDTKKKKDPYEGVILKSVTKAERKKRKAAAKKAKITKAKKRGSDLELAERRQNVLRLRLKGHTIREIGKLLDIGFMTAQNDLSRIREDMAKRMSTFDVDMAVSKALLTYDQIEREAWFAYHNSPPDYPGRASFLNLVRTSRNDQNKLLMDLGYLQKAPTKIEHSHERETVLEGWNEDAKQVVSLAIIQSLMTKNSQKNKELADRKRSNGEQKLIEASSERIEVPVKQDDN